MKESIRAFPYQWIIGIILMGAGGFMSMVYSYANLERDVEVNTISRMAVSKSLHDMALNMKIVREGLIAKGIISVD